MPKYRITQLINGDYIVHSKGYRSWFTWYEHNANPHHSLEEAHNWIKFYNDWQKEEQARRKAERFPAKLIAIINSEDIP